MLWGWGWGEGGGGVSDCRSSALPHFLCRALLHRAAEPFCAALLFDSDRVTLPPMSGVGGLNILTVG